MAEQFNIAVKRYAAMPLGREIFERCEALFKGLSATGKIDSEGAAIAAEDIVLSEGLAYLRAAEEIATSYGLPPDRGRQIAAVFLHPRFAIDLGVKTNETEAYLAEMKQKELQERLAGSQDYQKILAEEERIVKEKADLVARLSREP